MRYLGELFARNLGAGIGHGPGPGQPADVLDTFTGADGTRLGAHLSDSGHGWTEDAGVWDLSSNRARLAIAAVGRRATLDSGRSDGRAQVTLASVGDLSDSGGTLGLAVRMTAGGDGWVLGPLFAGEPDPWAYALYQMEAGLLVLVVSVSAPMTPGDGDVLQAWMDGGVVTGWVNGSQVLAHTSGLHRTSTRCGLVVSGDSFGGAPLLFDAFSVTG